MELIYIALLTTVASGVGTLAGFGTSTVLIPIVVFFLPLPQTLLLVGIIHWCVNIWRIALFKEGMRRKLIIAFGIPGIIATFAGARIILSVSDILLSHVLGGFLMAYAAFLLFKPSFKLPQNNLTAAVGGTLSGLSAGTFGMGGAVRGAFLGVFDLPKAVYIATTGAISLAIDSTRLTTYIAGGIRLDGLFLWGLLLFIPASFLGARIAKMVTGKIPQNKFRMVIASFLLLAGIRLLFFPS